MLLSPCELDPGATILIRLSENFSSYDVSTLERVKFILAEGFNSM